MERSIISPLALFFTLLTHFFSTNPVSAAALPADFIRTSCKATAYPDVCIQSLSTYASAVRSSPRQLAHAAIAVSAKRTHDASTYLSALPLASGGGKSVRGGGGPATFSDCTVAMADSTRQLRRSVEELRRLGAAGSRGFAWRISNVQTWVSAALTDQNACLDSLSRGSESGIGGTGAVLKKKVMEVSRVTSNALSIVNRIGSRN